MKIIEIKRLTTSGIKTCSGVLLELGGIQFCLIELYGIFYAIELSSGGYAYNSIVAKSFDEFKDIVAAEFEKEGVEELIKVIERFKKERTENEYPINKQLK